MKCISSFFTWSVFSPLCDSQLCVSLNAIVVIHAVASSIGLDVRMAPSSTYKVVGDSVILPSLASGLSSVDSAIREIILWWISPIMGEVK